MSHLHNKNINCCLSDEDVRLTEYLLFFKDQNQGH